MSTCISSHGEFSSHTLDESYTCTLCGVLDEEALREELERLRAKLAGWGAANPAPETAPELPWALHTPEGYRRLRVHVWPSLEAPRTVSLSVADGWAEFTAEEIEDGIAAMSEAVRRIREHAAAPVEEVPAP